MSNLFQSRMDLHDKFESEVMNIIRPFTDRRHLPDRRISFHSIPVSFDVKTTCNVEKSAHDEYFRLVSEGESVFIVYKDHDGNKLANWITELTWSDLMPATNNSTCGDDYYIISGGKNLLDFAFEASEEESHTIQRVNPKGE